MDECRKYFALNFYFKFEINMEEYWLQINHQIINILKTLLTLCLLP